MFNDDRVDAFVENIGARLAAAIPGELRQTAEQIAKGQAKTGGQTVGTSSPRVVHVEPPANSYRTYQPSDFLRISVPANWDAIDASAGGGRQGITTPLRNVSPVTGEREYVTLSTTQLRDGSLLYIIGVAPQSEAKTYENTFRHVRQSLQIAD